MSETTLNTAKCYKCNTTFEFGPNHKISRSTECASCKASLRCCKMCVHFDLSSYNECREPVAERLIDKEKANFCEFFMVNENAQGPGDKNQHLNAAMSLFKK